MIADLLKLSPRLEPSTGDDHHDALDPAGNRFVYRFFRDAESAPFIPHIQHHHPLNAWYLAESSMLAYADAGIEPDSETASADAAAALVRLIGPSIGRLFAAHRVKRPPGELSELAIQAFVRSCPVLGLSDPVQCWVADDGHFGVVAFRGTRPASLADWLTDCSIGMLRPPGVAETEALVHEGFWRASSALLDDSGALPGLHRYLEERRRAAPHLRLWFTGHSYGAALATLAAFRLRQAHALYTFGSPRVGNSHFANAFSSAGVAHHRVVHRHDVVPSMPLPVLPLLEYEHVGELRYIEARSTDSGEPAPMGGDLPATRGGSHAVPGIWERVREAAAHVKLGNWEHWLGHVTDHALPYYSTVLWNEFVASARHAQKREL